MKRHLISRRTWIFLVLALLSFTFLEWRAWEVDRPCREWVRSPANANPEEAPVTQPDGTATVEFIPCGLWYQTPWTDKALVLIWLFSTVGLAISFAKDILRWRRRRSNRPRDGEES